MIGERCLPDCQETADYIEHVEGCVTPGAMLPSRACAAERHFRIDPDGVFIVRCEQPARHFGGHQSREHRIAWSGDDSSKPMPWQHARCWWDACPWCSR